MSAITTLDGEIAMFSKVLNLAITSNGLDGLEIEFKFPMTLKLPDDRRKRTSGINVRAYDNIITYFRDLNIKPRPFNVTNSTFKFEGSNYRRVVNNLKIVGENNDRFDKKISVFPDGFFEYQEVTERYGMRPAISTETEQASTANLIDAYNKDVSKFVRQKIGNRYIYGATESGSFLLVEVFTVNRVREVEIEMKLNDTKNRNSDIAALYRSLNKLYLVMSGTFFPHINSAANYMDAVNYTNSAFGITGEKFVYVFKLFTKARNLKARDVVDGGIINNTVAGPITDFYATPKLNGLRQIFVSFNGKQWIFYSYNTLEGEVPINFNYLGENNIPNCVLDCELTKSVVDRRFVYILNIIDLITYDGTDYLNLPFPTRSAKIKEFVTVNYSIAIPDGNISFKSKVSYQIKDKYDFYFAVSQLTQLINANGNKYDGIIFFPSHPYNPNLKKNSLPSLAVRTLPNYLDICKWKKDYTVDLKLVIKGDRLWWFVKNSDPAAGNSLVPYVIGSTESVRNELADLRSEANGSVIEVSVWDGKIINVVRIRNDKQEPNEKTIVEENVRLSSDVLDSLSEADILGNTPRLYINYNNTVKRQLFDELGLDKLTRESVVVDIGSGRGGDITRYQKLHGIAKLVIFIEPDKDNLTELRERAEGLGMVTGEWTEYRYISEKFEVADLAGVKADLIVSMLSLSNLFDNLNQTIAKIKEISKIGTQFVYYTIDHDLMIDNQFIISNGGIEIIKLLKRDDGKVESVVSGSDLGTVIEPVTNLPELIKRMVNENYYHQHIPITLGTRMLKNENYNKLFVAGKFTFFNRNIDQEFQVSNDRQFVVLNIVFDILGKKRNQNRKTLIHNTVASLVGWILARPSEYQNLFIDREEKTEMEVLRAVQNFINGDENFYHFYAVMFGINIMVGKDLYFYKDTEPYLIIEELGQHFRLFKSGRIMERPEDVNLYNVDGFNEDFDMDLVMESGNISINPKTISVLSQLNKRGRGTLVNRVELSKYQLTGRYDPIIDGYNISLLQNNTFNVDEIKIALQSVWSLFNRKPIEMQYYQPNEKTLKMKAKAIELIGAASTPDLLKQIYRTIEFIIRNGYISNTPEIIIDTAAKFVVKGLNDPANKESLDKLKYVVESKLITL